MSKTVIFFIKKVDNSFNSYRILEENADELKEGLLKYNGDSFRTNRAEIVTDQHVIDAIILKDSIGSIKNLLEDWRNDLNSCRQEMSNMEYHIEQVEGFIKEHFEIPEKE